MIRRMFLLVVLTTALAPMIAFDATAQEELVDLAWLMPSPADLEDAGYGLAYGVYHPVAEGGVSVTGDPGPLTSYDEAFRTAGARQTYYQMMTLPDDDDPDIVARIVSVVIGEFADEDGAESGLVELTGAYDEGYDQTRTPPEVGDEALAFRGAFADVSYGRDSQELSIVFRTGRFLADVGISNYLDDAPAISELMPIAELLAERLEETEAAASPELALQVARIASPDLTTYSDYYTRRGGEQVPVEGDLPSEVRVHDEYFEEIGATDLYFYLAEVLPAEDTETFVNLVVDLRLFTDSRTAEAFLETAVDDYLEGAWDYQDIQIINDAEELGDTSAAVSFTQETAFGERATGYRFWVRAGDRVATVELQGIPAIPLPVAREIVATQRACFETGTCVEPIPVSKLQHVEAGATPVGIPAGEATSEA